MELEIVRLQRLDNGIEQLQIGIELMHEQHGIAIESPTMILKAHDSPTIIQSAVESPTMV
jgi:hypothetical protein